MSVISCEKPSEQANKQEPDLLVILLGIGNRMILTSTCLIGATMVKAFLGLTMVPHCIAFIINIF